MELDNADPPALVLSSVLRGERAGLPELEVPVHASQAQTV